MGDLLSAASLLLAVVAVLYGLWYPELMAALAIKVPPHKEDRDEPHRRVSSSLFGRAVPLAAGSSVLALVFLPDAISILLISARNLGVDGLSALRRYDAVRTSFCLVVTFAISLGIHAISVVVRLIKLRRRLSPR